MMKLLIQLLLAIVFPLTSMLKVPDSMSTEVGRQQVAQGAPRNDPGTPRGTSEPAGSRPESTCPPTETPLTAINHGNESDFTLGEYPIFFFYNPYSPENLDLIEFSLYDKGERRTIYKTQIEPSENPGIIQLRLPEEADYALEVNQTYRWYLTAYCSERRTDGPDVEINGWIHRKPMTEELEAALKNPSIPQYITYMNEGIWYDAVSLVGQSYASNPQNQAFKEAWENLLQALGREHLSQEPLINPVVSGEADE
ncbi:DUF928 domain-containing protein [Laspinema olomoucense]|uniref:DUF928 domain-containing protein n=1 Tax=Laspinema olomoucense TaxID=3231600 RepID=UPI0021BA5743|nr:DUF928 domain-containing protein [Laspinema sp. D3d]MCT7973622.1 DUF928 domain-containing protein [Laspinema sp. D3d]